jgi:hypothetical protein
MEAQVSSSAIAPRVDHAMVGDDEARSNGSFGGIAPNVRS